VDIFQDHLNDFFHLAQDLKIRGVSNENEDKKKAYDVQNTITSGDLNISEQTKVVSKPLENYSSDFSLDFNTDYKDNDFVSTINGMMEKVGKMWYCKVCGKEYTSKNKSSLREHVESYHTTGFTHTCNICQTICSTKNALRCHISRHHNLSKDV